MIRMKKDHLKMQVRVNKLSCDEDVRQELWLHVLSDASISDDELARVEKENSIKESLQVVAGQLVGQKLDNLVEFMNRFSNIEKDIMMLSIVGLSLSEIADYLGIGAVRVASIIQSIEESSIWEVYYGSKKKIL